MRTLSPLAEDITDARHLLAASQRRLEQIKAHAHDFTDLAALAASIWADARRVEAHIAEQRRRLRELEHPGRRRHVTSARKGRRGD